MLHFQQIGKDPGKYHAILKPTPAKNGLTGIQEKRLHIITRAYVQPFCYGIIDCYYSKLNTIRPFCGPSTHLACDEGPIKSVVFTLLRTGGITFIIEIPVLGKV